MSKLLAWMIASTAFKKFSGQIGALALGLWFATKYGEQIDATLGIWGIKADAWQGWLVAVIGAAGMGASISLSGVKSSKEKTAARASGPAGGSES